MYFKSLFLSSMLAGSLTSAYHIAVADQNSKTVRVFDRNADPWNQDAIFWSWTAEGGDWFGLNDGDWGNIDEVKIRKTADRGWVALVTTSVGKVGIIDITSDRDTNIGDVVWSATPVGKWGNPHSIERIPYVGAIVVASSAGDRVSLYAPSDPKNVNDLGSIKYVDYWTVPFAHGVLWDPKSESLWALGKNVLVEFKVVGEGLDIQLVQVSQYDIRDWNNGTSYDGTLNGHDLQPSYRDDDILLLTHTKGAVKFSKSKREIEPIMDIPKLKSLVETEDGEYIWIQGENEDMGQYVSFSNSSAPEKVTDQRGWDDAKFYKARIYNADFY